MKFNPLLQVENEKLQEDISKSAKSIPGCMVKSASNYNKEATVEDGSCLIQGKKWDAVAKNYVNVKEFQGEDLETAIKPSEEEPGFIDIASDVLDLGIDIITGDEKKKGKLEETKISTDTLSDDTIDAAVSGDLQKAKETIIEQQGYYNEVLLNSEKIQNIISTYEPYMQEQMKYVYEVLAEYDYLTTNVPPNQIAQFHDNVTLNTFESILPKNNYGKSLSTEQTIHDDLSLLIGKSTNADGDLDFEQFLKEMAQQKMKDPAYKIYADQNGLSLESYFQTSDPYSALEMMYQYDCASVMNAHYRGRYVTGYGAGMNIPKLNPNDLYRGDDTQSSLGDVCYANTEDKIDDLRAYFEMLKHYNDNGNLSMYDGAMIKNKPSQTSSPRDHYEYAYKRNKNKLDYVLDDDNIIQEHYNKNYNKELKVLKDRLLVDAKGNKVFGTKEEQILLDEFLGNVNEDFFIGADYGDYMKYYTPSGSKIILNTNTIGEVKISGKRGIDNIDFKTATLPEKLKYLQEYKKNIIKEINAQNENDVITILSYLGLPSDTKAIKTFQKNRQNKISFIEQLQNFEEKHLPIEEDGKLVYPTDPQKFDRSVRDGIGNLYFALDQFDDWFTEYCKDIFRDKYEGGGSFSDFKRGMDDEYKNNPDKYMKPYIGSLVSKDDKEAQSQHWKDYTSWKKTGVLPESMLNSNLFSEHLYNSVAEISKTLTDQYGMTMEATSLENILSTVGIPSMIADEIRAGWEDIMYYNTYSEYVNKRTGSQFSMGTDGVIRWTQKDPFSTSNPRFHNPLVGTGFLNGGFFGGSSQPQLVGDRWCITPLQRLDGYYVDKNNNLQRFDLSKAKLTGEGGEAFIENYNYGVVDQGALVETMRLKIDQFVQGKMTILENKQKDLFGSIDEKTGELDGTGALDKWQAEYGEKFAQLDLITSMLNAIQVRDGQLVIMKDGQAVPLSEAQMEYYQGLEVQFDELSRELITGSKEGIGTKAYIEKSAMLELQQILSAMDELDKEQELLKKQLSGSEKTKRLLKDFDLNFSTFDKIKANIQMTFGSVITPFGYSEYARKWNKLYQENYPQAYRYEWGNTARFFETLLAESTGSVSLFAVGAALSFLPGGQYAAGGLFFSSGAGGMYNSLTEAKIQSQAIIDQARDALKNPNISEADRLSLMRQIEKEQKASNQSESSIIFSSFCAGTIELAFERYITIPILKGPFKKGGDFATRWRQLNPLQKAGYFTGYQVATKTAEFASENLTTLGNNVIEAIQTGDGNGRLLQGIFKSDGTIDIDAQMQLLTTTLLISGTSDAKLLANIVSAEISTTEDRKTRQANLKRFEEITKRLKELKKTNPQDIAEAASLNKELSELQEKIVIHTEQSISRLKYLNENELNEVDGYAEKKRLLNLELFNLGKTKDPKNPKVIKEKNKIIKKVKDLQLKIDGVIEQAIVKALPSVNGKKSYGTKETDNGDVVVNWQKVRPEAKYLHGLYLSSNIRTRKTIEENGGLYYEINENSYKLDNNGNPIGFNDITQNNLLNHYKKVYKGDIAKATKQVSDIFSASITGKFASNIGKDAILYTTNAMRAIFNVPTKDGKTVYSLQQAQDAAVSGIHEVFHVNHAQTELNVKVGEDANGLPIYKKMTVSEIVNSEQGKQHAEMVMTEMDAMMEREFGSKTNDKEAQAIYEHYKQRRNSYKDNNFEVEEVLNIIGDLIATGNFANVNPKFKDSGVLSSNMFNTNSSFGLSVKNLINGLTSRLVGKEYFGLGQFDNAEQVFNYINRFYKDNQSKKDFSLIQRLAGDELDPTMLKQSMSVYEKNLNDLKEQKLALSKQYQQLIKENPSQRDQLREELKNKQSGLNTQISKIEKNIKTSKENSKTISILKKEQLEFDERKRVLEERKATIELHGKPIVVDGVEITLEDIIEQINNLPMSNSHKRAKDDLVNQNMPAINKFINDNFNPTASRFSGITYDDFVSGTLLKVAKIIDNYNPNELVTDVNGVKPGEEGYINTTADFGYYLISRLNPQVGNILKETKSQIAVDAENKTVSYDDADVGINLDNLYDDADADAGAGGDGVSISVESSEIRTSLNINDKTKNNIINKVGDIIIETGTPDGKKKKIRNNIQNIIAEEFKAIVSENIGPLYVKDPVTNKNMINPQVETYLKKNKELIVNSLAIKYRNNFPELSYVIKERASTEETRRIQANPDYKGFMESETAGNTIYGTVQFDDPGKPGYMTEQQFLDLFFNNHGKIAGIQQNSGNRTGKTRFNKLIERLSAEMGLDASFDAIKQKDPTDKQNYITYYSELIKRDPNMKFSQSGVDINFETDYNFTKLPQRMNLVFAALEGKDHSDIIVLDPDDPNYMTIKGFKGDFSQAEVNLAYTIIRELGPDNIDETSVRLRTTIIADENVPQWFKDKLRNVSWSSSKEMKDKKSKQVVSFYTKHVGAEVAAIMGYDLVGFHNAVMDAANRKKLRDGKATVSVKKIPTSMVDGKKVKNASFYGHDNKDGKFGVWDVVGWEFVPELNMFRGTVNGEMVTSTDPVTQYGAVIRTGDYNADLVNIKTQTEKTTSNTKVNLDDVRLMNKTQPLFKKIDDILSQPISKEDKIALLKDIAPEIEAANTANRALAVDLVGGMLTSVADGDMDADVFVSILQSQTNLTKGLRALSGLDFITVKDGAQTERSYGEHMDPNVRLMIKIQNVMWQTVEFDNEGNPQGFKEGVDPKALLTEIFADHTQWYTDAATSKSMDKPVVDGIKLNLSTSDLALERFKLLSDSDKSNIFSFNGDPYLDRVTEIEINKVINSNTAIITQQNEVENNQLNDDLVQSRTEADETLNEVDPELHQKYSQSGNSATFNEFVEITSGVDRNKQYSAAQARLIGSKYNGINNVIPYSAEDFNGLIYQFLAPGKEGEYQLQWFQEKLVKPYSKGEIAITQEKQKVTRQYKELLKTIPKAKVKLRTSINRPDGKPSNYNLDHAVRVYLWDKNGIEIPGLSARDRKLLLDAVKENNLTSFADQLGAISNQEAGYIQPSQYWTMENIASDVNQIINVVGRQKHLAEFLENKNEIFSEENLNKIEAIHGSKYREALENMLDRMETGSSLGKRMPSGDRITNAYNNWVNNSVGAIMFLNGRSAVLQTLSTFNYVKLTGPNNMVNAGKAFANQPQFWKDFSMIWNSDYLKSRREGEARGINEAELRAVVEKADNKAKAAIAYLLKIGFTPTRIADSFAIASGGASYVRNYANFYETQINPETNENYTPEQAMEKAMEDFVMETETGQQSSRQDMLSQQQTGGLGRLILAFKNTPMQYTRKILRASQDIKNNRGNTAENIGKIVYYGAIQNAMFVGLQTALFAALGEEDEEWEKKEDRVVQGMIDSILGGMGLTGAIVATVKNGVLEFQEQDKRGWNADHTYTLLEFANFSPTIGSKLRKIYSSIKGQQINEDVIAEMDLWDPQNPAWSSVANLISGLTNIPLDRAVNKINNLLAISADENEWWQNLSLVLGWNTWDVGVETKVQEIREEVKEKKKEEKKQEKIDVAQDKVDVVVEEEIKKEKEGEGKDVNTCAAVKSNGQRCTVPVDKAGDRCQYHASAEEKAKMKKCSFIKKNGKRCGNFAVTDAGTCNVPQHQPGYKK
jgi:hypothetical protein